MTERQGWAPDFSAFHHAGTIYTPTEQIVLNAPEEGARFSVRGSLAAWSESTRIYGRPDMRSNALHLLAAFASPLMELVGGSPVIMFGNNRTSPHRAIAAEHALSVWGNPLEIHDMGPLAFVENAGVFAAAGNLPVFVPKVAEMQPMHFARMATAFCFGLMNAKTETTLVTKRWCNIMIVHGQTLPAPSAEHLGYPAPLVVPYVMASDWITRKYPSVKPAFVWNYGVAGGVFAAWMVQNAQKIPAWVGAAAEHIAADALNRDAMTHLITATACMIVAGTAAANLKLIQFDPAPAFRMAVECVHSIIIPEANYGVVSERRRYVGCLTPGCKNKHSAKGYCKTCYQRTYMKDYMKAKRANAMKSGRG